jgi:hypothetical protein
MEHIEVTDLSFHDLSLLQAALIYRMMNDRTISDEDQMAMEILIRTFQNFKEDEDD